MVQPQSRKRKRRYQTHWSVRATDRIALGLITVGGIGTILTVSAVCLFLVAVVIPLFLPGTAEQVSTLPPPDASRPVAIGTDEHQTVVWSLFDDGRIRLNRIDTGEQIKEERLFEDGMATAWAVDPGEGTIAVGFDDGTVRLGTMGFDTDFPEAGTLGVDPASLSQNAFVTLKGTVVQLTPERQLRRQTFFASLHEPITIRENAAPVRLIAQVPGSSGLTIAILTADGRFTLSYVRETENFLTGETETEVRHVSLPPPHIDAARSVTHTGRTAAWPAHIRLSESGNMVLAVWPDGAAVRYDVRPSETPVIAEQAALLGGTGARLTAFGTLIGGATVLAGGNDGVLRLWFPYLSADNRTPDRVRLAAVREIASPGQEITAIASSQRSRVVAIGYADGSASVVQTTAGARILEVKIKDGRPIRSIAISPKDDGLVAWTDTGVTHWMIDLRHPEASLASLFKPVWYEGYPAPAHVWQSTGGTDDFEPKLGMWPLIFGTVKATFYSMLFGAPLALLAAIFSSEFLHTAVRTRLKTLIEFMASLPSVVLGFLAALVFAPFVQTLVPAVLASFFTVPGTFLIAAYLWQLLPDRTAAYLERYRLLAVLAVFPLGIALATSLGPLFERALFIGDLRLWLDGNRGSAMGGWLLLLLPVSAVTVAITMSRVVLPWFRKRVADLPRRQLAPLDLARFAVGSGATVIIALIGAWFLHELGLDPRGKGAFLDTYVQRNAMIVGFVMGFAIIPIIYTIAEDALSSVPDHLRAASLGAGATAWQTATRIVIPAAMSGLFSALMIGLGRAVGETMIVLMAAGNTPILDINIFNGFRTLSANIAVELPEAVRNSTHYRTLFLAALLLFTMTFLINTVAEIVRLRFRKRAHQL